MTIQTLEPNSGAIGLVAIGGVVGKGIEALQWANGDGFDPVQHAFGYLGRGRIAEAQPGGSRITDLSDYRGRRIFWLRPPATVDIRMVVVNMTQYGMGKVPYSFLDYAALDAHRMRLPVPWLKDYIASTGHQICSQAMDWCAGRAGWKIFNDGRWPGYVTPGALYQVWRDQSPQISEVIV